MPQVISNEKVTYSLPSDLLQRVRKAVARGVAPSQNALIKEAVERELRRLRDEELRREMEEAALDPEFLRRTEETMDAFETADAETARVMP